MTNLSLKAKFHKFDRESCATFITLLLEKDYFELFINGIYRFYICKLCH